MLSRANRCVAGLLVGAALMVGAGAAPASAATEDVGGFAPAPLDMMAPSGSAKSGGLPGEDAIMTPMGDSGVLTGWGGCKYRQSIEDPHLSSGDTSVHGYWKAVGGDCPSLANVDVYLQAYWCDRLGCRWRTVSSNSGDVRAGGGRGKRITSRETCASSRVTGWRAAVDVDLHGQVDPPGYTYSSIKNLACAPS